MRVLVVSDEVEASLYNGAIRERVGEVDLILSCGDLPFYYIEFIVSMLNRPCYYVFGNHGREIEYQDKGGQWLAATSPEGAVDLHCRTAKVGPLLLAGLEGSIRYNQSSDHQYTNAQMWLNVLRLAPKLLLNRLRYGRYLDVLVTHSPPRGIHDQEDNAHRGFTSFLVFMRWFKPKYLLHGHVHLYRRGDLPRTQYHETEIINIYPFQILEIEIGDQDGKRKST